MELSTNCLSYYLSYNYQPVKPHSASELGSAKAEDPMMPKISVEADLQELVLGHIGDGSLAVLWLGKILMFY